MMDTEKVGRGLMMGTMLLWNIVCIVVVVLCVLLSYVYLLYYMCIVVFNFRCRTAG